MQPPSARRKLDARTRLAERKWGRRPNDGCKTILVSSFSPWPAPTDMVVWCGSPNKELAWFGGEGGRRLEAAICHNCVGQQGAEGHSCPI
jgi:hypothetical protein